jgi:hypothetical protein
MVQEADASMLMICPQIRLFFDLDPYRGLIVLKPGSILGMWPLRSFQMKLLMHLLNLW